MEKNDLQLRLKKFAIAIVQFAETLPNNNVGFKTVKNQICRSSTSAAANYRAACRGRSKAEFIAKLGIVEEELDETMFWLEFIVGLQDTYRSAISDHWKEANELLSIIVVSIKTARK